MAGISTQIEGFDFLARKERSFKTSVNRDSDRLCIGKGLIT